MVPCMLRPASEHLIDSPACFCKSCAELLRHSLSLRVEVPNSQAFGSRVIEIVVLTGFGQVYGSFPKLGDPHIDPKIL